MKNKIDIENGRYWDRALSLVDGCTPCSPGCDHCWSAAMTKRFDVVESGIDLVQERHVFTDGGKFNGHIITHPDRLDIPLRTRKPTVFSVWNDLFHERVTELFRDRAYDVMIQADHHIYLILTKRPQNMDWYLSQWCNAVGDYDVSRDHIWHGLTVCNQAEADEKIPVFLQVSGKKFLSIEPMLGPISLRWLSHGMKWRQATNEYDGLRMIDAVILGGETGPGARPMHPDWAISIVRQCKAAGVPFFFKQWGEFCELSQMPESVWTRYDIAGAKDGDIIRCGRKKSGRLLDGLTHDDLPWVAK